MLYSRTVKCIGIHKQKQKTKTTKTVRVYSEMLPLYKVIIYIYICKKGKETDNNDFEKLLGTKINSKLSFDDHVCVHMHMYMYMSIYIYTSYAYIYINMQTL